MGCVQSVLDPAINAATIRLLTRLGFEVVVSGEEACCGSLTHHMGKEEDALARARRSVDQWTTAGVDAVIVTASGCGTTIKDYGHMLRLDAAYAEKAKAISAKAKDVTEFLIGLDLPEAEGGLRLAYHSACSMQHGQKIRTEPQKLLRRAGFSVVEVPEGHLCCGSAGTYNILQPEIAASSRRRKVANIESTAPQAIATGNIGCITQIGSRHRHSDPPHDRASRLGLWRPEAGEAGVKREKTYFSPGRRMGDGVSDMTASVRHQRSEGEVLLSMGAHGLKRMREAHAAKVRMPQGSHEAILINTGGGLAGGDRFTFTITAEENARLTVTSQAAERVYRSLGPAADVEVRLAAHARRHADVAAAGDDPVRRRGPSPAHHRRPRGGRSASRRRIRDPRAGGLGRNRAACPPA